VALPAFPPVIPLRDHLPTRLTPFVNYTLIAANVFGFIWERSIISQGVPSERLLLVWGLVPARLFIDPMATFVTVFTSMFMHNPQNLLHLGGNMLFLWIFGDNVEDAMGHGRYLSFYLLGGIVAAAVQTLADPMSHLPMVGASGAISAVLAAYMFLYPRSPITVFFVIFLFDFPAWLVITEFFLVNLWSAFTQSAQGGVAFLAHVGGFVGGALLLRTFMTGRIRVDEYARWNQWRSPRQPR
jgi:membrane associated rhomboid family serine protease